MDDRKSFQGEMQRIGQKDRLRNKAENKTGRKPQANQGGSRSGNRNTKRKIPEYAREIAESAGNILLDLLYPPRCPICQEILKRRRERVCDECREKLPYIEEPACMKCGKPLNRPEQEYCPDCERAEHEFIRGRAIFLYEKSFRHSVHRMKFGNHREYLDFYAEEMAEKGRRYLRLWRPRTLIPVPMNRKKRRERGFDQSYLLAKKISRLTGIPMDGKSLIRNRYTLPQKELDARSRRKNLSGAFTLREGAQIQEPVLLIDDIYTTGATVDAVCRTLKENGIHRIYFLALCTGKGK